MLGAVDYSQSKIMLVDDIPTNTMLLKRILSIEGFEDVQITNDARTAVQMYLDYKPDVLILDLKMPFMDGFQVMEQLNEVKGDDYLPVIIITAQNDQINRLRAYELGAKDFIGKPFENTEVIMRIRNMLEIRRLHNKEKAHNQKLQHDVFLRNQELHDLRLELVHRLVKAAEFRDNNTGLHVNRISFYSYELAVGMGLSQIQAELIKNASALHDIGKIVIPDEILLKPGPLNEQEWEKMKSHTVKGAEILAGSNFAMIQMAEIIAMTHHEWWNGQGYPRGLQGEEIPLAGRITAVCDVFDALVSERPYKSAWSLEEALKEMRQRGGTHFDPQVSATFFDILPRINAIREEYHER